MSLQFTFVSSLSNKTRFLYAAVSCYKTVKKERKVKILTDRKLKCFPPILMLNHERGIR